MSNTILADPGVFLLLHPSPHGGIRTRAQRYKFIAAASGFTRFLMNQIELNRRDPVGDFARDVQFDTTWAPDIDNLEVALRVIDHASDDAKDALRTAWAEYVNDEPTSTYHYDVQDWVVANTMSGRATTDDLLADYARWCRERGYRPRSKTAFSRRLTEIGYPTVMVRGDGTLLRGKRLGLLNKENAE